VNTETLYADLAKLQNDGCPAVDIVELALRCTAGGPQNVEEALLLFGLTRDDLLTLRDRAEWMSDKLIRLLESPSGEPLLFPAPLTEGPVPEFDNLRALPTTLTLLKTVLDSHPLL